MIVGDSWRQLEFGSSWFRQLLLIVGSYGTWQVSYRVGSHMKLVMVSVSVSSSLLCYASILPPSFHCYIVDSNGLMLEKVDVYLCFCRLTVYGLCYGAMVGML